MAADLPVRGPVYTPPPAVAIYNWSGCYIGANVGGGWTSNSNTFGDPLPDPVTYGFVPMNIGTNGSGVVAGGQAGCNLQVASNFVVGIEGDLSWSGVKGEGTAGPIESIPPGAGFVAGSVATSTHKVAWVGTVRGRAGVAFDTPAGLHDRRRGLGQSQDDRGRSVPDRRQQSGLAGLRAGSDGSAVSGWNMR